jgi:hypothetical protein
MIGYLRQSTAATIDIGPIVDSVDATPETAQTIAQADVQLRKTGTSTYGSKNESTSCTHRNYGIYTCPVDATDTNTLGILTVAVFKTGTMVWKDSYTILPANIYDSLILGTDYLQADTYQLAGFTNAASALATAASVMQTGTTTNAGFTATSTIFETGSITEATTDHYKGRIICFTNNAVAYQASAITAYSLSGGRGRFTVNSLTEAVPDATTFIIL